MPGNQGAHQTIQSPPGHHGGSGMKSTNKILIAPDGTQLSSKMGAISQDTQATSMLTQGKETIRFPMSAEDASRMLAPYLWEIERREIFEYETIFFFPVAERKKERNTREKPLSGGTHYGEINEETNNGFDNDQQEYIVRYNEHLGFRYEVIKKLGKGSFGIVLRVFDHK